jgi:hypothetical protein
LRSHRLSTLSRRPAALSSLHWPDDAAALADIHATPAIVDGAASPAATLAAGLLQLPERVAVQERLRRLQHPTRSQKTGAWSPPQVENGERLLIECLHLLTAL